MDCIQGSQSCDEPKFKEFLRAFSRHYNQNPKFNIYLKKLKKKFGKTKRWANKRAYIVLQGFIKSVVKSQGFSRNQGRVGILCIQVKEQLSPL